MKKTAMVFGVCIFPLVVYPTYFLISVLPDIAIGDKSVIFLLSDESPGSFIRLSLADWWAALPFSYMVVCLFILPVHMLFDRFKLTGIIPRLLSMVLVGGMMSLLILRLDSSSTAVLVLGGSVLTMLFHFGVVSWRRLQGAG